MTSGPGAWLDLSAGVAGDMLLAALIDAGAPLVAVQAAVEVVMPGIVRLSTEQVTRRGLRATHLVVRPLSADQPDRRWAAIRDALLSAPLKDGVRQRSVAAFTALARAEARVHGVPEDDVHFHEVGAWDAIADVVGVCAALDALGIGVVSSSPMALGSGKVGGAHGVLPVPVPAVLELCRGVPVVAGGDGELATPTGVALATTLCADWGSMPAMTVSGVGVGAGSRERSDRPNVVRVVTGQLGEAPERDEATLEATVLIETTVDDLDPRVWPSVLEELLEAGAADSWLTPVLMKKGRPGQVLSVLAEPRLAAGLRRLVLERTSTLGVRQSRWGRETLERAWSEVDVPGGRVRIKVAARSGLVLHATPEFEDAARVAARTGRPVREVLEAAVAAAVGAGLSPGAAVKDPL